MYIHLGNSKKTVDNISINKKLMSSTYSLIPFDT